MSIVMTRNVYTARCDQTIWDNADLMAQIGGVALLEN